jgi:hypothetical protein
MEIFTPEILDAINNYYKLKSKYESKCLSDKQKIMSNTNLTKREKHSRFLRIKKVCIVCKKEGGTIFTTKDRILKAICGSPTAPCQLDIEIQLGSYATLTDLSDMFNSLKDEAKWNIIKTKLDLLFNYIDENKAIATFESHKRELQSYNNQSNELITDLMNISDNPTQRLNLERGIVTLYEYVNELKGLMKQYESDPKPEYMQEIMSLYLTKINPILERNNHLKYKYNAIEINEKDDTFHLIQKKYTLSDIEISLTEDAKIIKNNY